MANENHDVAGVNAHLSGVRWFVVAASVAWSAIVLTNIYDELCRQNKLREQELKIQIHQTEIMQRQYTLDSLKFSKGR